jgi:hypothetical protein
MKVRLDGRHWVCECGHSMMYGETIWDAPRRKIVCANPRCEHRGQVFLEPVFQADPVGG